MIPYCLVESQWTGSKQVPPKLLCHKVTLKGAKSPAFFHVQDPQIWCYCCWESPLTTHTREKARYGLCCRSEGSTCTPVYMCSIIEQYGTISSVCKPQPQKPDLCSRHLCSCVYYPVCDSCNGHLCMTFTALYVCSRTFPPDAIYLKLPDVYSVVSCYNLYSIRY